MSAKVEVWSGAFTENTLLKIWALQDAAEAHPDWDPPNDFFEVDVDEDAGTNALITVHVSFKGAESLRYIDITGPF